MIEIQLSTRSVSKPIVQFDGHVIDFFFDSMDEPATRVHLAHIKSLEVVPVAHGKEKYALRINCEYKLVAVDVSEETFPSAQELVAAIHKARASIKL